jgi:hypothetical protein
VYETDDEVDFAMSRSLLEEAGITVFGQENYAVWAPNASAADLHLRHFLQVRKADAAYATSLLEEYHRGVAEGRYTLPEGAEVASAPSPPRQRSCFSAIHSTGVYFLVVIAVTFVLFMLVLYCK